MWDDKKKTNLIYYGLIAVIAIVVMVILRGFYSEKPKQAYTAYSPISPAATEAATEASVNLNTYTDPVLGFSIGIPDSWVQATSNQGTYFIHRPSSTGLIITVSDYDKYLGDTNSNQLASELIQQGYTVANVEFMDNSSYVAVYGTCNEDGSVLTQYIDFVTWDREHSVKLSYICSAINLEDMFSAMQTSMNSFVWEKGSPIPEDCYLQYYAYGDFEIGLPIGWTVGVSDTAVVANDTISGAVLSIEAYETDEHIGTFTQNDYINFAMGSRMNYYLSSCSIYDDLLYAQSSFTTESGVLMTLIHYIVTNGLYEYIITIECPTETYQSVAQTLNNCFALFRCYATDSVVPEPAQQNTPDTPLPQTQPSQSSGRQAY